MSLSLGSTSIGSMYVGGRKIAEAWLGSSKVFGQSAPSEVTIGGRTYSTVTIGNQVWMAENLDWKFSGLTFRDGVDGNEITNNVNLAQAAYYDYDESTYGVNGNKYGLLYNWASVDYINSHLSELGVPSGWHVPTHDEWSALKSTVGEPSGTKLKSTTGWETSSGTDDFGFSMVPAGDWVMNGTSGVFTLLTQQAMYWTPETESASQTYYAWTCHVGDAQSSLQIGTHDKRMCVSVRLVKSLSSTEDESPGGEIIVDG